MWLVLSDSVVLIWWVGTMRLIVWVISLLLTLFT